MRDTYSKNINLNAFCSLDHCAHTGIATDLIVLSMPPPQKLQEVLPKAGLVVSETGQLTEVLCKPKILPLKSVTLERIEKMEVYLRSLSKTRFSFSYLDKPIRTTGYINSTRRRAPRN